LVKRLEVKLLNAKKSCTEKLIQLITLDHSIFKNVERKFKATRYHSLIIDKKTMPKDFLITAETNNKIIMGIAHKKLPIFGLQFHPESIGTDMGKIILKNFLNLAK